MSAPTFSKSKKRSAAQIRRIKVLGRIYQDNSYKPQYAVGIMCRDESDQVKLHARLARQLKREIKVLVI